LNPLPSLVAPLKKVGDGFGVLFVDAIIAVVKNDQRLVVWTMQFHPYINPLE